jgi:hypothetical protein
MKCCPISKQEEQAQATQPTSGGRPDSGFGNILAVASKDVALLYLIPGCAEKLSVFADIIRRFGSSVVGALCIRLI